MKSSTRLALQYKSPYTGDWWTAQMIAPMVGEDGTCREDENSLLRRSKTVLATYQKQWKDSEWRQTIHKGMTDE